LIVDLGRALGDLLTQTPGRSFCDGCLAIELHVARMALPPALDATAGTMDRGHGRCSVCGQTLTVTRIATE